MTRTKEQEINGILAQARVMDAQLKAFSRARYGVVSSSADCACDWDAGQWFPCPRHQVSSDHSTHTENIPWCEHCRGKWQRRHPPVRLP